MRECPAGDKLSNGLSSVNCVIDIRGIFRYKTILKAEIEAREGLNPELGTSQFRTKCCVRAEKQNYGGSWYEELCLFFKSHFNGWYAVGLCFEVDAS